MKKLLSLLLFVCSLTTLFAQQLTVEGVRQDAMAYLREEGYVPKLDEDGDLYVKLQGYTYSLLLKPQNDGSVFAEFYAVFSTDTPYQKLLEACNAENCERGVFKYCVLGVEEGKVNYTIGYEFFYNPKDDFHGYLHDAVTLLPSLVADFVAKYES